MYHSAFVTESTNATPATSHTHAPRAPIQYPQRIIPSYHFYTARYKDVPVQICSLSIGNPCIDVRVIPESFLTYQ